MLTSIRIVLINTFHPGNIGAAARAMKNMGLSDLYLVDPVDFPHPEADSRAAGAGELLDSAHVVNTLEEAITDCTLVIGTSARSRNLPWPMLNARECGVKVIEEARQPQARIAIVFGRERMGLHNDELRQCQFHVAIDASPDYPVLNVSAALQIIAYEIWMAAQETVPERASEESAVYPDQRAMLLFYEHLETTLKQLRFILPQHEGKTMLKLQRFFNRGRPEVTELNMLRGILSAVQRELKKRS